MKKHLIINRSIENQPEKNWMEFRGQIEKWGNNTPDFRFTNLFAQSNVFRHY